MVGIFGLNNAAVFKLEFIELFFVYNTFFLKEVDDFFVAGVLMRVVIGFWSIVV